jgi:Uma2 family endonuclease
MLEQQKIQGMSLEDFMIKYEEQPFELIDGDIVIMASTKFEHNTIQHIILEKLFRYIGKTGKGIARMEMVYVTEDKTDWLKGAKVPDVMYIQQERLDKYYETQVDYKQKPLILVPDMVVEIVSPTDLYTDVNRKVREYLSDGVKIIWVIDPKLKTVAEYTQAKPDAITKRKGDVLSGGDVAKGFELVVSEIFEN